MHADATDRSTARHHVASVPAFVGVDEAGRLAHPVAPRRQALGVVPVSARNMRAKACGVA